MHWITNTAQEVNRLPNGAMARICSQKQGCILEVSRLGRLVENLQEFPSGGKM